MRVLTSYQTDRKVIINDIPVRDYDAHRNEIRSIWSADFVRLQIPEPSEGQFLVKVTAASL